MRSAVLVVKSIPVLGAFTSDGPAVDPLGFALDGPATGPCKVDLQKKKKI
jgi:hypothetical protein